jgi:hypothetical protein
MGELDALAGPMRETLARDSRCLGHGYQGVACVGWRRELLIRSSSSLAKVWDQNEKVGQGADAIAEWDGVERRPPQIRLCTAYMALVQRQTQALRKEFQLGKIAEQGRTLAGQGTARRLLVRDIETVVSYSTGAWVGSAVEAC